MAIVVEGEKPPAPLEAPTHRRTATRVRLPIARKSGLLQH